MPGAVIIRLLTNSWDNRQLYYNIVIQGQHILKLGRSTVRPKVFTLVKFWFLDAIGHTKCTTFSLTDRPPQSETVPERIFEFLCACEKKDLHIPSEYGHCLLWIKLAPS